MLYFTRSQEKEQTLVILNWTNIFLVGLYFYFLNFICGIWSWGMASSFWNHVVQISNRQVHFQDIYSQLWIVKIFSENIYFLLSKTYFREIVMHLQYGVLYLILTRPKFAVWEYMSRSQSHVWGNKDWCRAIPRKGKCKLNFRCSAVPHHRVYVYFAPWKYTYMLLAHQLSLFSSCVYEEDARHF